MTVLLQAEKLVRSFGGIMAVNNCSIQVKKGSITGLIGPNGSGKTTIFNLITNVYKPDSGRVYLDSQEITGLRPNQLCHRGLSRTFQITRLFWDLSVLENMIVPVRQVGFRSLLGPGMYQYEAERAHELLRRVSLDHMADQPARKLSFGQQKLLEFAAILMSNPDLVMLDEPAGGVNPTMIRFIMDLIRSLNQEGVTFLVVEHNMSFVMELCDHIIVMNQGEKIAEGPPLMIQSDPVVLDAYLGD
ncbi:MAG: ABC transporter ATP-binding protein [Rubrivivax sp.]|jgi:ABC-type branched-subunit amino acid transport system ATPase component|nr:ABC transporter ATP-binding protein [Rubrivivax sp.]